MPYTVATTRMSRLRLMDTLVLISVISNKLLLINCFFCLRLFQKSFQFYSRVGIEWKLVLVQDTFIMIRATANHRSEWKIYQ